MATLKLTPKYFNPYEAAYNTLSHNEMFKQSEWERWAKKGQLDQYINVLSNTDKISNKEQFYKDYNLEYGDDKLLTAAAYNEIFANKTDLEEHERYAKDEAGKILTDEKNNPIIEKYSSTEYDYRKQLILDATKVNYEKYLKQQEQERKDSMNGFVKFWADVGAAGTEIVLGLADAVDNLFNGIAAIGRGVEAAFKGENVWDAIVETNASDEARLFENLGLQQGIIDFESRYTRFRDLDGNYSGVGKYIGGVANTLGQMLPAMIGGKGVAKLGASSTMAKATSTLVFYGGMTTGNVRDMYKDMAKNNVSVCSADILANSLIKSTLQYGVEVGLGKILGGTALDNMVFGRSVGVGAKSLAKSGAKRVLKDFVQEGLEEVFQETSDFLVDRAFTKLIGENFGEVNLSWQTLGDSFIIGGLASLGGSAMSMFKTGRSLKRMLNTKRVEIPIAEYDKDGDIKYKKLGKIASWEYGLNMQSFLQNFVLLQEQAKGNIKMYDSNSKEGKQYAAAFTEMYAAYRIISSIYNEIGEERFKNANDVLTKITSMINAGKFDSITLGQVSGELMETLADVRAESFNNAKEKLLKANATKVKSVINRDDDLSKLDENIKQEVRDLFAGDSNIKKVILTEDGKNIVVQDELMFIPVNYANKADAETIYETVAEQTLVEKIITGKYKGLVLDDVLSTFKQVSGKDDATMEEAIYNLVFNDSFFKIVLSTANKDTYNFVSSLINIERNIIPDKLKNTIYKQKMSKVIENMKKSLFDYLVNQPLAEHEIGIFTAEEERKIAATRWCRDLYARVINNSTFKKLSDNDWRVLENRVNSMVVSRDEKDTIIKNLHSENSTTRIAAMNRIATVYAGVFTAKYDGKTYMPDTNIPNRTFNAFLQNNGLTIDTLINTNVDESVKNTIVELYDEFNQENLIKFRQTQFMQTCNNKYTFRYNKQGKIGVYEANTNKQVGFSAYNEQINSLVMATALDKRTVIEKAGKRNYLVKGILNDNVDEVTAAYLSIDDVISDPSLLSEQIQADILRDYGDVNIENAFLYLRGYFLKELETTTIIVLSDGSYAFGNVRPMLSSLKVKDIKIDENVKISQLIKSNYLYGRLENIKIRLTNKLIDAEYDSFKNIIYINSDIAKKGGNLLTFAFLHEFQHAVQVENGMNIGINAKWIESKTISKTTKQNIINDVRKHRPELFKDVEKGGDTEAQIVNDFVYYSSGESTAYGIDASQLVNFYPTLVKDSSSGTKVSFPWGSSYTLTDKIPMSFMSALNLFNIDKLSKKNVEVYKEYITESYNVFEENINHIYVSDQEIDAFSKTKLFKQISNLPVKYSIDFFTILATVFENTENVTKRISYSEQIYNYFTKLAQVCDRLLPDKGFYDDIIYVSDLLLPNSALRIKLDTINTKSYSAQEFVNNYWTSYRNKLSNQVKKFTDVLFNKFENVSKFIISDIKTVGWMYDEHGNRDNNVMGFSLGNLIRFRIYPHETDKKYLVEETYVHEVAHFILSPFVKLLLQKKRFGNERLYSLMLLTSQVYNDLKNSGLFDAYGFTESYPMTNLEEFVVSATNESFLNVLKTSNSISDKVKSSASYLIGDFSNESDLITNLFTEILNEINVAQELTVYKERHNIIKKLAEYEEAIYPEYHEGRYGEIHYDKKIDNFYRVAEDGEIIYKGEKNYFRTSLGTYDVDGLNQSLTIQNESDEKLYRSIEAKLNELYKGNKKLSIKELINEVSELYPFVAEDIINEIATAVINNTKLELDKLNELSKSQYEERGVAKRQNRTYTEPENGETVIENKSKNGKWIKKVAKVDSNGEYVRDKEGKIVYRYVYDTKRYTPQNKNKGTNLEKFGYINKYKRTQLSEKLQSFIVNANENIDSELWEKVKSGKITTQAIMDYFRDSKTIDYNTFKLINDSYFHNVDIKTFEQLEEFVKNKTPKYYAAAAIAKELGYSDLLASNADVELLDKFLQIIEKDSTLKNKYDTLVANYDTYKGDALSISNKNLRRLWMQYFDGTMQSASYLATIAKMASILKWSITGEIDNSIKKSLQDDVGEDMKIEEVIADERATDAFESIFYSKDRESRVEDIMKIVAPKYVKKLLENGLTNEQAMKKVSKKWQQLMDMDDKEFAINYAKIVKNMSEEEINTIFARQLVANVAGVDVSTLSDKQLENLSNVTEKIIPNSSRPASAVVNNIRSLLRTIKRNLSDKTKKRFLRENNDIVTEDLKLKEELFKTKDSKGRDIYIDVEDILPYENRIRELSKQVRQGVYKSERSLKFKKELDKKLKELQDKNDKLLTNVLNGKEDAVVTSKGYRFEVESEEVKIDTNKEIPATLKRLLKHEFTKQVKSKTQYLVEGDRYHFKTSITAFLKDNAEFLNNLSQEEINEIVDFYLTSEILPSTSHAKRYSAIQLAMLTYLIKENRTGKFVLTDEQIKGLEERANNIVGISAQNLANWKEARKMLKPAETIMQSLARSCGITFSEEDITRVIESVKSGDINRITEAKQQMYKNGLKQASSHKNGYLDRIWKFERLAMLSGPGTAIRNKVSNALVTTGNKAGEQVGKVFSSMIERLLPKKKWKRDNQYVLVGTKVTSEVQNFIKTQVIDSGLFDLIKDGINKYDVRKYKQDTYSVDEPIEEMVINSIKSKIFQENAFKTPLFNKAQNLILKLLSDDKSINRAAIRYFGKMLVEDKADLSHGLSVDVLNTFAEAYKLAAFDYMHKSNFFNKIENRLKEEVGDTAYFMYKQIFPFAATSWNWFVEGIKYTPLGLAKSIINFAKLENTIERMDDKRQKGEQVISSRFAEYLARRDIGKGVIGSIGTIIGAILAALGFAGIDEEDDKYKLFIRIGGDKITIDISDLFGTQGIMLGITVVSAFKDGNWLSAFGDTFDTMFNDSMFSDLFNTFRYSNSFGEWLMSQPFAILNMLVPNFFKTFSSMSTKYKVKYSSGILGQIERLATNAVPGLAYAFPKQVDPYTGENQIAYKMWFVTGLANKLLPFNIYPYNVSDNEKEAIVLGVNKEGLSGRYEVNGKKVTLSKKELEEAGTYYGKLNKKQLDELMSNRKAYKVWDDKKEEYVEIKYSKMSDKQKKAVIERIMSNNSQIAKIYILTSSGKYNYYADDSEYKELKKLGITRIYKKTDKLNGFKII